MNILIFVFIFLLISFLVDIKKNKASQKRNRYFLNLFYINIPLVTLAFLASFFLGNRQVLFGEAFSMIASFLLALPIIGYLVGAVADKV